ncbi:hypothetical protein GCM10022276_28510 [Sphingomonas limnosediminicola]|uniref:Uncharacterized protein n=2 Tax=Sphingomonas limnosediminicola TaxID=940133 RepID=A0ABP7LVR4_9SPHN
MMATQSITTHRLDVLRLALTGAITAAVVFALCWLGTLVPFSSPTHAYIRLFTPAEISSDAALAPGLCWSFLFGGLSGAVLAIVYNILGPLGRK